MRPPTDERGNTLLFGLGITLLLFGLAGLAIDTWRVFAERQALASLADAASIVGANAIDLDRFRTDHEVEIAAGEGEAAASAYLARHAAGVAPGISGSAREVLRPGLPTVGVEVTVEREVSLTLVTLFTDQTAFTVRATAFALPGERAGP